MGGESWIDSSVNFETIIKSKFQNFHQKTFSNRCKNKTGCLFWDNKWRKQCKLSKIRVVEVARRQIGGGTKTKVLKVGFLLLFSTFAFSRRVVAICLRNKFYNFFTARNLSDPGWACFITATNYVHSFTTTFKACVEKSMSVALWASGLTWELIWNSFYSKCKTPLRLCEWVAEAFVNAADF